MLIFFITAGVFIGSFLNMLGHRLLTGKSLLGARSCCPHCGAVIAWYDVVPLFSYLWLQGKCRSCNQSISWLYPFIEMVGGVAGLLLFSEYAASASILSTAVLSGRLVAYGLLLSGFMVGMRTDFEALVVPRVVIIGMGLVGLLAGVAGYLPVTLEGGLLGALLGYSSLWLLNMASRRFSGREGIGEGDMELLAVVGLFWGPIGVWSVAFMSSVLGIVGTLLYLSLTGKNRYTRVPFIPFMALASGLHMVYQREIIGWLLH